MTDPAVTYLKDLLSTSAVLDAVLAERGRQDKKWGVQSHPSHHPHITSGKSTLPRSTFYAIPEADLAKARVESAARNDELSWAEIAIEEFCEAIEAGNETDLRTELVQCAAVLVAWVEHLDRTKAST